MRRAHALGIAAAALGSVVLAACGSSGTQHATGSTTPSAASTTNSANPNAAELNAAGDIPDNQAFVTYSPHAGSYSLSVPEGWARTNSLAATTFSEHFNSIHIKTTKSETAPTVATATATEVPTLRRSVGGFALGNVTSVNRTAGPAILVTYRANSAPDAITGKRLSLDVERYEFWHNGTQVTLTLSAPHGADNVDPWKRVTESFAWSA